MKGENRKFNSIPIFFRFRFYDSKSISVQFFELFKSVPIPFWIQTVPFDSCFRFFESIRLLFEASIRRQLNITTSKRVQTGGHLQPYLISVCTFKKRCLTKPLNESSINGLRATNADIKCVRGGKNHMVSIRLIYSKCCDSDFYVPTTLTLLSNVQEVYSHYAKDLKQRKKLISSDNVTDGKRTVVVEHKQSEEKESQLLNEQKQLKCWRTRALGWLQL